MLKTIKSIACVAYIECLSIIRDKTLALLVLGTVFIYLAGFGLVYKSAILLDIPVAVIDQDNSPASRELAAKIANNPRIMVVHKTTSPEGAERLFQAGKIRAMMVIPQNYELNIKRGEPVRVLTEVDGTNLIYAYNLRKAINDINRSLGADIMASALIGAGLDPYDSSQVLKAIELENRVLYNPTNSDVNFLYLLLIVIALQQTCLMGEGITLSGEREQNTLVQFSLAPLSAFELFAGKALPYYLIVLLNSAVALVGAFVFLKLPFCGNAFLFLATFAIFALCIVGMGFWISSFCRNAMQSTMIISLFNIPMVMGSGLIWPFESMAPIIKYIAYLFPYTWMAHAARAITLKGAGIELVKTDLIVLGIMAAFFLTVAVRSAYRIKYSCYGGVK